MEIFRRGQKVKKLLGAIICFVLVLIFVFAPSFAFSATLQDLQKQREQLRKEIEAQKKAAEEKQKEAQELQKVLSQIDATIAQTEAKIRQIETDILQTTSEISQTFDQILKKEDELKIQKQNLNETLVAMYEMANKSTWEILLGFSSLSEVINYTEYIDTLELKIENTISVIEKIKKELEDKKKQLEDKKAQLQATQQKQQNYQKALEGQKIQRQSALGNTKAVLADLQSQIEEAKKYAAQLDAQIASLVRQRQVVNVRDKGTSVVGLAWPCDYIYISQYFGEPWNFDPSTPHTGIDLVNAEGTPIYASAGGTVYVGSQGSMGYGNYIIIYHNARFATLYGHLSGFTVSTNEEATAGQLIGYMGSTGWSTGPHLHFEVWEYGTRVNPLNYLP